MKKKQSLGKFDLTIIIVGSSIGTGIFGLGSDLAKAAAPGPALIAWLIVGTGAVCLVASLNNLGQKQSESGIFGYAGKCFGPMGEFVSGWIYWISGWMGNVAYAMMLMSAIGFFMPELKGMGNFLKIFSSILILWFLSFLVSRGIKSASFINAIATCAKVIPLVLFIVVMAVSFKAGILTADFWGKVNDSAISGTYQSTSVFKQISSSLTVMVWAFYGLEGASLLSKRAEKPSDARIASIIGMIILLVIYMLISLLPYGVLSRHELASCPQPAMSCIMQKVVGTWGVIAINSGIVISTLSAWLAWTLLPGETLMILAKDEVLPKVLGKQNEHGAPENALIFGAILQTFFLISLYFTKDEYDYAYTIATSAIFIVYLFVGLDQIKYSYEHEEYGNLLIGIGVIVPQIWALLMFRYWQALGLFVLYLPGLALYAYARKECGKRLEIKEKVVIVLSVLAGIEIISMAFF